MSLGRREIRVEVLEGQYTISELIMFTDVIKVTEGQLAGNKYAIADETDFEREGGTIVLAFVSKWPRSRKPQITATQHNNGTKAVSKVWLVTSRNPKITVEQHPRKARRS